MKVQASWTSALMRLTSLLQRLWLACSAGKEAKWGTIGSMGNMKDIADSVRGNLIPQLYILRRVPMRYSRILPLTIMKRFQCIVVGSAQGVLTVAITDRQNISVIESLRKITGQAIFPVLIDPTRMRLLIQRVERYEQYRQAFYATRTRDAREQAYYLHMKRQFLVFSIVLLLTYQKTQRN